MKRALEVILVAAALGLAGFVTMKLLAHREPAPPAAGAASRPGRDEEDPRKPAAEPYARAVKGVPMIKLAHPPRPRPRKTVIPAPVGRP